jgi:hypothetical protein
LQGSLWIPFILAPFLSLGWGLNPVLIFHLFSHTLPQCHSPFDTCFLSLFLKDFILNNIRSDKPIETVVCTICTNLYGSIPFWHAFCPQAGDQTQFLSFIYFLQVLCCATALLILVSYIILNHIGSDKPIETVVCTICNDLYGSTAFWHAFCPQAGDQTRDLCVHYLFAHTLPLSHIPLILISYHFKRYWI